MSLRLPVLPPFSPLEVPRPGPAPAAHFGKETPKGRAAAPAGLAAFSHLLRPSGAVVPSPLLDGNTGSGSSERAGGGEPSPSSSGLAPAMASLEELLPELVRKIAWSGDARRGAVRLEVGAGALAGATLLVQAEYGRVHVTLHAAPGAADADAESWRDRIEARLAARGLDVGGVEVE